MPTRTLSLPIQTRILVLAPDNPVDVEKRTVRFSFASENPVLRHFGDNKAYEILDMSGMDTGRLKGRATPLLLDHDRTKQIGKLTEYHVEAGRAFATAKISRSAIGTEALNDLADGVKTEISCGYIPRAMTKTGDRDGIPEFTVSDFEIVECSVVSIPLDASVGVGRGAELDKTFDVQVTQPEEATPSLEVSLKREEKSMSESVATPETPKIELRSEEIGKIRSDEQTRIRELTLIGKRFACENVADDFINESRSIEDFRKHVMEKVLVKGTKSIVQTTDESFAGPKERASYSLIKALREGARNQLSGLELEASDQISRDLGRKPQGFFMPEFALTRDLSATAAGAAGNLLGGASTIQTTIVPDLIELLRNRMVIGSMGVTTMGGLQGNIEIPRQSSSGTAYFLSENAETTPSSLTFDYITLSPKRLAAVTRYSQQLLAQSVLSIEQLVRNDLLKTIAVKLDYTALYGRGAATYNEPLGIANIAANPSSGAQQTSLLSAPVTFPSGNPTYASVLGFETALELANIPMENTGFVVDPQTKQAWKGIPKAVNYPVYLWEGEGMDGTVAGYKAVATNQVQNHNVFFGAWDNLILANWSGLDIIVDNLTLSSQFMSRIVINTLVDQAVRYGLAFCMSSNSGVSN